MESIAFFYLPNLTDEEQQSVLSLSNVGRAEFVNNGETTIYSRLRNIELVDLETLFPLKVWTFPDRLNDTEDDAGYIGRVKAESVQAFNNLRDGSVKAIWLSESGFTGLLQRQQEYKDL